MTELKERLNKAKVLTTLDLKNGYHLVRMTEEDEENTAFRTRFGLYYWRVMPFAFCNAPATFQSMMDNILHDVLDDRVIISKKKFRRDALHLQVRPIPAPHFIVRQ